MLSSVSHFNTHAHSADRSSGLSHASAAGSSSSQAGCSGSAVRSTTHRNQACSTPDVWGALRTCPWYSLPFVMKREDDDMHCEAGSSAEAVTPIDDVTSSSSTSPKTVPVVLSEPTSALARLYSELSDGVIRQIFRTQIGAQQVPTVHLDSRGVILRYFTPSSGVEFVIPPSELRQRDPKTGTRIRSTSLNNSDVHTSVKIDATPAVPVNFDIRGNYGVAIEWSDGHYADIFSFEVLRQIAEDCSRNEMK